MQLSETQVAVAVARSRWLKTARRSQIPEFGHGKTIWLYLAGRGAGKTRSTSEEAWWVLSQNPGWQWAVVTPTYSDLRRITFEGESGFRSIVPPEILRGGSFDEAYNKTEHTLTFANGSVVRGYSSETPDRLRGPQHHGATCEELAAWPRLQDTWDMLRMGLRLGENPKTLIATTPRPLPLIKSLVTRSDVETVRGKTIDNAANLAASFLSELEQRYSGTRLGRQELEAEIIDDVPGALWTRAMFDDHRVSALPEMQRIVVGVDPSGGGDSQGIVAAGKGVDGRYYVLADRTCKLSPAGWGARAVNTFREFRADRIVAERNFGGDMVEATIKTADPSVPIKMVTASRGKVIRAEPIAAIYEQGRVSHYRDLAALEDQACSMTHDGFVGDGSPDRVDALVWAITELHEGTTGPRVRFG